MAKAFKMNVPVANSNQVTGREQIREHEGPGKRAG